MVLEELVRVQEEMAASLRAIGQTVRQRRAPLGEVGWKGRSDPVTEWDRAIETQLMEQLGRLTPEIPVWSEESRPVLPSPQGLRWILDPLDGTLNATHGFPHQAIALALQSGERIELGWVYDLYRDQLFFARRGHGAYLDGRRLTVSAVETLSSALIAAGALWKGELPVYQALAPRCQDLRRGGSAALDLAWVAAGWVDGFIERRLQPWDVAAGALLVEEAHGRVTDLAGTPLSWSGPLDVVASNRRLHSALLGALQEAGLVGG